MAGFQVIISGRFWVIADIFNRDHYTGGGGGGAGGNGGNGGSLIIYTACLLNPGDIHAHGGAGGIGGDRGTQDSPCPLEHASGPSQRYEEGANGNCGGGTGGESDCGTICSNNADDGDDGDPGSPGQVIFVNTGADVQHYDLDLTIDPDTASIQGTNVMTVYCECALSTCTFRLDQQLDPTPDVYVNGTPVTWNWLTDEVTVLVELDRVYNAGETFYLQVDYAGQPRTFGEAEYPLTRYGMHFTDHAGIPMVYVVNEPWFAYLWFPVKDDGENWNCDKATADLAFTIPTELYAVSTGTLQGIDNLGAYRRFRWSTDYPTAAYLFSVAVTNYDKITCPNDDVDVFLYLWPEDNTADHRDKWCFASDMLDLYASPEHFGPFPFANEKYAIYQWPKMSLAMEYQTATGQPGKWLAFRDGLPRVRVWEWHTCHELAHSWWGDEVTCANWNNIWLNEGLACWSETLWFENQYARYGRTNKLDMLRMYTQRYQTPLTGKLLPATCYAEPIYLDDVSAPDDIMVYCVQYKKAPRVLHMLRHLSDRDYNNGQTETFFNILQTYRANQAPSGCATTEDFQAAAEQVFASAQPWNEWDSWPLAYQQNLDWFFNQWIYNGGAPAYKLQRVLFAPSGHVQFKLTQRQVALFDEPVFAMPIDIDACCLLAETVRFDIWNDEEVEIYDLYVGWNGCVVDFDPDGWLLYRWLARGLPVLLTDLGSAGYVDNPAGAINNNTTLAATLDSTNAFRWLPGPYHGADSGLYALGTLNDDPNARVFDVNDPGEFVGESVAADQTTHAWIWLPESAYNLPAGLHPLPDNGAESGARALNDLAQIVGFAAGHATLWKINDDTAQFEQIDLGTLDTDPHSAAWDINNAGQIVGWSGTSPENCQAVIWEYNEQSDDWTIDLLELDLSQAFCINDLGIVGGRRQNGGGEAIIWALAEDGGGWIPSPMPVRGAQDAVYDINNVGQAVGVAAGLAARWDYDPTTEQWLHTDLNSLIADYQPCGTLKAAWGINDDGQIIGYWDVNSTNRVFAIDLDGQASHNPGDRLDACDILDCSPTDPDCQDCNLNGLLDEYDIAYEFSADINSNGIPDECEVIWCLGDMNCSGGSPTFEDILYFATAVGNEAGWEQYYRDRHAGQDPPCPWLLGDYGAPAGVDFSDIIPFANSVGQDCIPY